jgi:hypothetical protein
MINSVLKNLCTRHCFVLYTQDTQKLGFPQNILYAQRNIDMYVLKHWSFVIFKCFFVAGAYAPVCQIIISAEAIIGPQLLNPLFMST